MDQPNQDLFSSDESTDGLATVPSLRQLAAASSHEIITDSVTVASEVWSKIPLTGQVRNRLHHQIEPSLPPLTRIQNLTHHAETIENLLATYPTRLSLDPAIDEVEFRVPSSSSWSRLLDSVIPNLHLSLPLHPDSGDVRVVERLFTLSMVVLSDASQFHRDKNGGWSLPVTETENYDYYEITRLDEDLQALVGKGIFNQNKILGHLIREIEYCEYTCAAAETYPSSSGSSLTGNEVDSEFTVAAGADAECGAHEDMEMTVETSGKTAKKRACVNKKSRHLAARSNADRDGHFGAGRGIEWHNNSCYMDSTLYSMLSQSNAFDHLLKDQDYQQYSEDGRQQQMQGAVRRLLEKIQTAIQSGHCPATLTCKLRQELGRINSRISSGTMMDVDEFVGSLFGKALVFEHFIKYSVGTGNYLHQLLVIPKGEEAGSIPTIGLLQKVFQESMINQGLKLSALPSPALLIKMPRSKGNLIGYDGIFPDLVLNLESVMGADPPPPSVLLHLTAVIVLRGLHYTCFVRERNESQSWVYADSLGPSVRRLPNLGREMNEFGGELYNCSAELRQLITDIHFCFYCHAN